MIYGNDGKRKLYPSRNWIWIIAGLILTWMSVKMSHAERGYMALGGEWLVFPMVLMAVDITRDISALIRYLFDMEDDDGQDGDPKGR